MSQLEAQFHQAMVDLYLAAKRDCHYNATYFLNMVLEQGGLATAKHLLATDQRTIGGLHYTVPVRSARLDSRSSRHPA